MKTYKDYEDLTFESRINHILDWSYMDPGLKEIIRAIMKEVPSYVKKKIETDK